MNVAKEISYFRKLQESDSSMNEWKEMLNKFV